MCGIAGMAGVLQPTQATASVRRMMSTLARRGPDADGLQVWSDAVLGHRRLAIFDLSAAGRQPMLSPDGAVGIVFNGAIYNFKALRQSLESLGYRFQSETDTEVLLHGYREWGVDKLTSKIKGMFAFAVWDSNAKKLLLVRDRLGVKPLVFATRGKQFAFASTTRALRAAGFGEGIDAQGIADFLEFGFVTERRTIHEGIMRVPPASILEWSENRTTIREYWRPPMPSDAPVTFDEAIEETERLFLNAVKNRLAADVPVGSLLSGGVDSSLVCWGLSKLGADISAYTVGTLFDSSDESTDARTTANQLSIRHRIFNLSAEDEPDIDELVAAYSEPFACSSALGMLRVSRAVKSEAKVLITGDGGDDVFLGYAEHRHLWLAERFARLSPQAMGKIWLSTRQRFPRVGRLRRFASLLDYASGGLGAVTNAHDGLPSYRQGVLGERCRSLTVDQRTIEWSHDSARNVLLNYLDYDRHTRFVSEFLTKVDGATMHYGLEARSPFLDQDLWEFASSLPLNIRLRHGKSKAILRELARRRLGDRVARGKKRGFTIPVERWMAGKWKAEVVATFHNSYLEKEGWIQSVPTLKWFDDSTRSGRAPKQLWYLFVLERWLRAERNTPAHKIDNPGDMPVATLSREHFAANNRPLEVRN